MLQTGPITCRPFSNLVQSQTPQLCVTGIGSSSLGSRRLPWESHLRLPTSLTAQPGSVQSDEPRLSQDDTDSSRIAQHALVLGSGQSFSSDSIHAPTAEGSGDTVIQQATSPKPPEPEPACLVPRAVIIQQKGFSDEVARIEAPQRLSTRAVYKSKWAVFIK